MDESSTNNKDRLEDEKTSAVEGFTGQLSDAERELFNSLDFGSEQTSRYDPDDEPAQAELFELQDVGTRWTLKDSVASMELPIFSLSKNVNTRIRTYIRGGQTVKIIPSAAGAATVFDKDILIYCISQIIKANDANKASMPNEAKLRISRRVKIDVYSFLKSIRRSTGGAAYESIIDMCRRLKGTIIETNVKSNEKERLEGFGLIESYKIIQYTKNGKGALEIELTISEWLYRAALSTHILTLDPEYFSLSQPLERRLYALGRKHCGQAPWFLINLPLLKTKAGSEQEARYFKQDIKAVLKKNRLPMYKLALDESVKPNMLVYLTRDNPKLLAEATRQGKVEWISNLLQTTLVKPKTK